MSTNVSIQEQTLTWAMAASTISIVKREIINYASFYVREAVAAANVSETVMMIYTMYYRSVYGLEIQVRQQTRSDLCPSRTLNHSSVKTRWKSSYSLFMGKSVLILG